jgi:hypothetical protein
MDSEKQDLFKLDEWNSKWFNYVAHNYEDMDRLTMIY